MQLHTLNGGSPKVAIVTPVWNEGDESGWALRQVASVLACGAEVHVVTTQGDRPRSYADGVFWVHEMGTIDEEAALRRDIVLGASGSPPSDEALQAQLFDSLRAPWSDAADYLAQLAPAVVLIADHRQLGAFEVVDAGCGDAATLVVPMVTAPRTSIAPVFAPSIAEGDAVICFTEDERELCSGVADAAGVQMVGVPLATNVNVLLEPEPRVADQSDYVLILTGAPLSTLRDPWLDLLTMRFASQGVVVSAANALVIYTGEGAAPQGWVETTRHNDVLRLMAWAQVTVDLNPGPLFGRRSLESLLHGTPIVVPTDSSAREHAERGSAGLWFDDPSGLLWCTEALLDPALRARMGADGPRYAHDHYGSRANFVAAVAGAVGHAAHGRRRIQDLADEMRRLAGGDGPSGSVTMTRGAR